MKQHYRLTIWSLFFLITSSGSAFAQRKRSPDRLSDNGRIRHRKFKNHIRISGENHGDTDE